jgi:hypothetical protein
MGNHYVKKPVGERLMHMVRWYWIGSERNEKSGYGINLTGSRLILITGCFEHGNWTFGLNEKSVMLWPAEVLPVSQGGHVFITKWAWVIFF